MGRPKLLKLLNFCNYFIFKLIRLLQIINYLSSSLKLLFIMIKYNRSIHRTYIISLPIQLSRIMNAEKMLYYLFRRQYLRIKCKLDDLCMTRISTLNFFVYWLLNMATAKTTFRFNDSLQQAEATVNAPIAPSTKSDHVLLVLHIVLNLI